MTTLITIYSFCNLYDINYNTTSERVKKFINMYYLCDETNNIEEYDSKIRFIKENNLTIYELLVISQYEISGTKFADELIKIRRPKYRKILKEYKLKY